MNTTLIYVNTDDEGLKMAAQNNIMRTNDYLHNYILESNRDHSTNAMVYNFIMNVRIPRDPLVFYTNDIEMVGQVKLGTAEVKFYVDGILVPAAMICPDLSSTQSLCNMLKDGSICNLINHLIGREESNSSVLPNNLTDNERTTLQGIIKQDKVVGVNKQIYSKVQKIRIVDEGNYNGRHYCIISLGRHPCAYVEALPEESGFDFLNSYYDDVPVHWGFSYDGSIPQINEKDPRRYLGWDYGHFGDYSQSSDEADYSFCSVLDKKWTCEEILSEVRTVIDVLNIKIYKGHRRIVSNASLRRMR